MYVCAYTCVRCFVEVFPRYYKTQTYCMCTETDELTFQQMKETHSDLEYVTSKKKKGGGGGGSGGKGGEGGGMGRGVM